MAVDFKKTEKQFYLPKTRPEIINVPEMTFIMIDGKGDPNTSAEYADAIQILYGLSYTIKMKKTLDGYFEYVVPPLEGLWSLDGPYSKGAGSMIPDKGMFVWTSMIRQPEFVGQDVFENARAALAKKKPELDSSLARLEKFTEGLCAQLMHLGAYDDEPATVAILERFIASEDMMADFSEKRRHHEVYLGDPRKTAPEKLKTVIRIPIAKRAPQ